MIQEDEQFSAHVNALQQCPHVACRMFACITNDTAANTVTGER